jgi:hypothetical protein
MQHLNIKYTIYLLLLIFMASCKAPSLNFGERYLTKNYEIKRRKKIKKYLDYRKDSFKGKRRRR